MINKDNITSVTICYDLNNNQTNYSVVTSNGNYAVPLDPANTDYQAIQEWIAAGNSVVDPNAE